MPQGQELPSLPWNHAALEPSIDERTMRLHHGDIHGTRAIRALTTEQHLNPAMHGHAPLLAFDGWEHAYYLRHGSRRLEALEAWWPIVSWPAVELRFALSWKPRRGDSQGLPARRRHSEPRLEN